MKTYINNLNLCQIRSSQIHGLGVFASENIKRGTIIDQTKPFIISKKAFYLLLIFLSFLKFFKIKDSTDILKILFYGRSSVCFTPSMMSYLNHSSDNPNIGYLNEPDFGFSFFAISDIKKDEELLLKYMIPPRNSK